MGDQLVESDDNDLNGEDFTISWATLYQIDGEKRFLQVLDLINTGSRPLSSQNWALYFNSIPRIKTESIKPALKLTRINGHFYEIKPLEEFTSLNPGDSLRISFETQTPAIKDSDMPVGFYLIFEGDRDPQCIEKVYIKTDLTKDQTIRTLNDHTPVTTPQSRYNENKKLAILPPDKIQKIIPGPVNIVRGQSEWRLDADVEIHYQDDLGFEATLLANKIENLLSRGITNVPGTSSGEKTIILRTAEIEVAGDPKKPGDEAYQLVIDHHNGVIITGTDNAGVFYGIQSLLALIPVKALGITSDKIMIEDVRIEDAPRFSYRGLHLDVARNFQSQKTVLKFLDLMGFYKLNKFHFHLTDDEGWRLEIKSLPELTGVGGQRGHTIDDNDRLIPSFGSGPNVQGISEYYTEEEFIEILKHAHERHIEVIPEIDIPGHARAAIKAMEARYRRLLAEGKLKEASTYRLIDPNDKSVYQSVQSFDDNVIDVCLPSTYRFLEAVIDEIINMYRKSQVPLSMIHIGGDEVPVGTWTKSPACDQLVADNNQLENDQNLPDYFLKRVHEILKDRGLKVAGWEEIALIENLPNKWPTKVPNKKYLYHQFIPYIWNNVWGWGGEDLGYRLANAGYKIVLCNASNLYFDCAYNKDPKEPGLYWPGFVDTRKAYEFIPLDIFKSTTTDRLGNQINPDQYNNHIRLSETGENNILGIQGQLWGEELVDSVRLEYMAFPKVLGLAERAWAKQPEWAKGEVDEEEKKLSRDWNVFVNSVGQREMIRLDNFGNGIEYRIPPPGAVIEDGLLKANIAYPGLDIRYTTDGTDPTEKSDLYKSPVPVKKVVKLRTFNSLGRGSRVAIVNHQEER
jgi:hexosaminidase